MVRRCLGLVIGDPAPLVLVINPTGNTVALPCRCLMSPLADLEDDPARVIDIMLAALGEAVGEALRATISAAAQRWRFARSASAGVDLLWDGDRQIGIFSDWLCGPGVEQARLSNCRLAGALIGQGVPRPHKGYSTGSDSLGWRHGGSN
jgi:hypothetical protein